MNFTFGQNTWYQITRVEGHNVHDQIAFCAFHSFLVEFQTNAGHRHETRVNNNLEIRIMGSSCRPQNLVIAQNKTKYLNNQLCINTSESIDHRNEVIKKYQYSPTLNGASRVFLTKFWRFWDVLPICDLSQGALAMMMATGRENVTVKKNLHVFKHYHR